MNVQKKMNTEIELQKYCQKCQPSSPERHECVNYHIIPDGIETIDFYICGASNVEIFISIFMEMGKIHSRGIEIDQGKYRMCLCNLDKKQRSSLKIKILSDLSERIVIQDGILIFMVRPKTTIPTLFELATTFYYGKIDENILPETVLPSLKIQSIYAQIFVDADWCSNTTLVSCKDEKSVFKKMKYPLFFFEIQKEFGYWYYSQDDEDDGRNTPN